jgi:hypothetical protein
LAAEARRRPGVPCMALQRDSIGNCQEAALTTVHPTASRARHQRPRIPRLCCALHGPVERSTRASGRTHRPPFPIRATARRRLLRRIDHVTSSE